MCTQATILSLDLISLVALPPLDFTLITPPPCWLKQNLTLGCVKEFVHVVRLLVPFASTLLSLDNVFTLQVFHPSSSNLNSFYLDSLMDF